MERYLCLVLSTAYTVSPKRLFSRTRVCLKTKGARDELGARLNFWSEPLYTEIFRFPDQVAEK